MPTPRAPGPTSGSFWMWLPGTVRTRRDRERLERLRRAAAGPARHAPSVASEQRRPARQAAPPARLRPEPGCYYAASTLYYGLRIPAPRLALFHRLDRIGLFLLIAGTYTPPAWSLMRGRWRWGTLTTSGRSPPSPRDCWRSAAFSRRRGRPASTWRWDRASSSAIPNWHESARNVPCGPSSPVDSSMGWGRCSTCSAGPSSGRAFRGARTVPPARAGGQCGPRPAHAPSRRAVRAEAGSPTHHAVRGGRARKHLLVPAVTDRHSCRIRTLKTTCPAGDSHLVPAPSTGLPGEIGGEWILPTR